jgi:hypothetical protein
VKHQEDFLAPLPGIEEKEVPTSTSRHQEAAALANQAWTRLISGVPWVPAIVEFMDLWIVWLASHCPKRAGTLSVGV